MQADSVYGGIVGAPTAPSGIGGSMASQSGGDNIQSIMDGTYGKWIVRCAHSIMYALMKINRVIACPSQRVTLP
eukprot:4142672-Pyramimonas_sp.AAC.3